MVETASTRGDRPKLRETLGQLQAEDTLVIYRLDRVGPVHDGPANLAGHRHHRASKSIGRHLARHGARIAAAPESFLVGGLTGALAGGELERARAWGQRLTRSDCLRVSSGAVRPPDAVHGQERDGAGPPWTG